MNNILTAKQAQQTAVMDWAAEQVNRGRWVDIVWDADLKSCAARAGAAGAWEKQVDGYGETEIEARIELMWAWDKKYGDQETSTRTITVDQRIAKLSMDIVLLHTRVSEISDFIAGLSNE